MITFLQAQTIAAANLLPDWDKNAGTFYVANWGGETDQYWFIQAGAREWLEDGNDFFQVIDDTILLVDKNTGQFIQTPGYNNFALLDTMKPYGDIPKNFQ